MSSCVITLGGKERTLKFNQLAIVVLMKKALPDYQEVTSIPAMVYGGLKGYCYAKEMEEDFTFEDVCDWCENITPDDVEKVVAAFTEAEAYKKFVKPAKDSEQVQKKSRKNTRMSG